MGRLSIEKKAQLFKIEVNRIRLSYFLENNFITTSDIISLSRVDSNYGIINLKEKNKKEKLLKTIYNCPFLLCDQNVDDTVKYILPNFLDFRFNQELDNLAYLLDQGFISKDEYNKDKDMLEFSYYKSSVDGKNILKNGCSKNISKNKVIKL